MGRIITLVSEADYRSVTFKGIGGGNTAYSNCIKCDRYYGSSSSSKMYRVDYDVDNNAYHLILFDVFPGQNYMLEITQGTTVASFDATNKKLTLNEHARELIDSDSSGISGNVPISKFISIICMNHENAIAGINVLTLLKKLSYLNNNALYNLLSYYEDIQHIEKLGDKFIDSISNDDFVLNTDARERHKALNLPKQVVQFVESIQMGSNSYRSGYSAYLKCFQNMMRDDGNELIAIVDYLKMYEKLSKKIPNQNGGSWNGAASPGNEFDLLEKLGQIKTKRPDLDLRKVLNYLVKQHFLQLFESGYANPKFDPIRFAATIPSKMASIYNDYLNMDPIELFPQDLYKSHNVLAIEAKINLDENEIAKFNEYGTMLSHRYNMSVDRYNFVVPTDYTEFVRIGKTFMNCLPTCGKAFYSGLCDIVFIYDGDEKTPKYAIELDAHAQVVQAKTLRDMDISDEGVLTVIDKYVTKLAKAK